MAIVSKKFNGEKHQNFQKRIISREQTWVNWVNDKPHEYGYIDPCDYSNFVFEKGKPIHINFNRCYIDGGFSIEKIAKANGYEHADEFVIESISIIDSIVKGKLDFQYAVFGDGEVNFSNSRIEEVDFKYTDFGAGDIIFFQSELEKCRFKYCDVVGNTDLRFKNIKQLIFEDCFIDKAINMKSSEKYKVLIGNSLFVRTTINASLLVDDSFVRTIIKQEQKLEDKVEALRILKVNANKLGLYDQEDIVYRALRRVERPTKNHLLRGLDYLFDLIGNYGTSPLRILVTILLVVFIFGLIFTYSPMFMIRSVSIDNKLVVTTINNLFEGLYLSGITFLTIGYGDITPVGWFSIIAVLVEGFLGVFLMSYFTVSVVRKTLR